MDKFVISGELEVDNYGCLSIGSHGYLIDILENKFNKGDNVFVRYFISDKEITEDQAEEALIVKTIGGDIESIDFVLECYSEYTIMEYNEELKIGGHDLFKELENSDGKFLNLIIEKQLDQ